MLAVTYFAILFALQLLAFGCFKYGSLHKELFVLCFILGNIAGASSMWLIMLLYRMMNANLANAILGGVNFILIQVMMILVFKSRLTTGQWAGILLVFIGLLVATLCGPASADRNLPDRQRQRTMPSAATE